MNLDDIQYMYRTTRGCACALSRDGLSFRGYFCSCSLLIFADMLPLKRDTEGKQMAVAMTRLHPACRGATPVRATWHGDSGAKRDQTRNECRRMAQGYWPRQRTSSSSPGLRSFGSNKQGPWLLRQLQPVTSHYTCLLATYYSCCEAILMHLAYA